MKKTWIKLKRGLLSREHRATMSECIWLYLYLLDICDWDKGIVFGYTDREASEALAIPIDTLRKQRRRLIADEYISCSLEGQYQNVTIHKWTNPRKYDGEVINTPHMGVVVNGNSDHERPPLVGGGDHEGYHEGDHHLIDRVVTPPINSESQEQEHEVNLREIWQSVRYATKETSGVRSPTSKTFRYIDATELVSINENKAVIKCLMQPEEQQPEWLEDRMKAKIESSFIGVLDRKVNVEFIS